jgi:hypothetical protein
MVQRRIPLVRGESLFWQEDPSCQPIRVGTPAWYAWLNEATSFSFESSEGTFTARKERVQRGGQYWKAYRHSGSKLLHTYLGKSEGLTLTRLTHVARTLAGRVESLAGTPTTSNTAAPVQQCRVDWGEALARRPSLSSLPASCSPPLMSFSGVPCSMHPPLRICWPRRLLFCLDHRRLSKRAV